MDIFITVRGEDSENTAKDVIEQINTSADAILDWKIEHVGESIYCNAICDNHVGTVIQTFENLLELYPALDISASYSYTVREEDRSANWFVVEEMRTEYKEDGTAYLKRSSGTYWN